MTATAETITIKAPNFQSVTVRIVGTSPLVQHRFWKKGEMMAAQEAGRQSKSRKKSEARDFEADFRQASHQSPEGWYGVPASAFRNGMISACRIVGFKMTQAKLAVFVRQDGVDQDGLPIVKLLAGEPENYTSYARNANGSVDIRARPMWREWGTELKVDYDADLFSATDVVNLLARVGVQVGVGEGRPDSKMSAGLGYGLFRIEDSVEVGNA